MGLIKAQTLNCDQAIAQQVTTGLTAKMFTLTTAEYVAISDEMHNRMRLQLLLVCSANLESYLNDSCFAYIASLGYIASPTKLNEIGEALEALYSQRRLCLGLGLRRKTVRRRSRRFDQWDNLYKLRCVVAQRRSYDRKV